MTIDLQPQNIRILIDNEDFAAFLAPESTIELVRSEPSPDMPVICGARFALTKAYEDDRTTESFDKKINSRFLPGQPVEIELYHDGQWRSPPFASHTRIKFAFYQDTGTHEICEIETQDKLAQTIEEDRAFDPERKYDAQGNEVPVTRDVLGVTRTLEQIVNSYLHVKNLGAIAQTLGFMTQTTNAYKEYLADSSDSEINAAQQMVWYNVDRPNELNFLWMDATERMRVGSIPLDLAIVTPEKRLFDCRWGLYTDNLLTYEPERNVEQLAEYIEVVGVGSVAQERENPVVSGGVPQQQGFSLNVEMHPITDTLSTTTIDWAGRTITQDVRTFSTPKAIEITGDYSGGGGGFGNQLVQQDITVKKFDGKNRCHNESIKRYVAEAIKLADNTSGGSINQPAYQQEINYLIDGNDIVYAESRQESAAEAIVGGSGGAMRPLGSTYYNYAPMGGGLFNVSAYSVKNPNAAQGFVPYNPSSGSNSALGKQCEYFPSRYEIKQTPLRQRIKLSWASQALTGRIKRIDVGSALLSGQNFNLLAESLARLHTAQHEQHNCSFPLSVELFERWQVPGRVVSVLVDRAGQRHHYYSGADSIEITSDSITCKTSLFWIGTTNPATGEIENTIRLAFDVFVRATQDRSFIVTQNQELIQVNV
jgi:hypothetical protein